MTLKQSSAETRVSRGAFFHPNFFVGELKRTWYLGLLWSVVLFFAYPVVVLLNTTTSFVYYAEHPEAVGNWILGFFYENDLIPVLYALIGGIFLGMVVMDCHFDKRKSHFISSLPVRREAVVLTKAAAAAVWHAFAWIPNTLLVLLAGLCVGSLRPYLGLLVTGILRAALVWLPQFLYFCGAALLAASVCGSAGMTISMIVLFIGYTPLLLLVGSFYIMEFLPRFNADFYLSEESFSAISATVRMFINSTAQKKPLGLLIGAAVIGLAYIALSVFLSRYRKSENAGNPFVFDRVRSVVKYLLMFLAGAFLGLLFYEIGGFLWMLFGVICGSVLCWMLCNTLFYKTPRMMFDAKRGMLIATAVILVFNVVVSADPFRIDRYVPSSAMTRRLELEIDNHTIQIDDPELIALYRAAVKETEQKDDMPYEGGEVQVEAADGTIFFSDRTVSVDTVWRTRFLLPVAKGIRPETAALNAFSKALTGKKDFAQRYFADWMDGLSALRSGSMLSAYISTDYAPDGYEYKWDSFNADITKEEFASLLETYENEMASFGDDALQRVSIGFIGMRLSDTYYNIPIYTGYPQTMKALAGLREKWLLREEEYGFTDYAVEDDPALGSRTANVYVNDRETGEIYRMSADTYDRLYAEGRIISPERNYMADSALLRVEPRYRMVVFEEREELWSSGEHNVWEDSYRAVFLEGKTPADLSEMLYPAEYQIIENPER